MIEPSLEGLLFDYSVLGMATLPNPTRKYQYLVFFRQFEVFRLRGND